MATKPEGVVPVPAPDPVEKIAAVLSAMGIARACFVDDDFSPKEADALGVSQRLAKEGKAELLRSTWGGGTWTTPGDDDDREHAARTWKAMDVEKRHALVAALRKSAGTDPQQLRGPLAKFWPKDKCPLDERAPERFDDTYLQEELIAKGPALLFIDLSIGEGETEAGISILQKVRSKDGDRKIICVIFTAHAKADREAEVAAWDSLIAKHGVDRAAAVVISKDTAKDRVQFGLELRRAFLNALAPQLLKWAKAAALKALEASPVQNFDGDVMDAIVLRSSEKEGIHPTETLFRMIDDDFRRAREAAALKEPLATDFSAIQKRLEALRKLETSSKVDPPLSRRVNELRRAELYRGTLDIAGWPTPSRLGDIWEIELTSGTKPFVLVAQPCDLILRSDGGRSQEWALLVPIRPGEGDDPETVVELPYFDSKTLESHHLALKNARVANTKILDLVALVGPTLDRERIPSLRDLEHAHLAVSNRARVIADWLDKALPPENETATVNLFLDHEEPAKFTNGKTVGLHCKRVERLDPELSQLVLQRYGQYVSRHAMPHDFAIFK